jgi:all-trans-8'-apo-beta-carotenal 15,15'-oxygenase
MDDSHRYGPTPSQFSLRSIRREHGFEPLRVEGRIPEGLEGTLYRVGPGLLDSVGVPVTHLFESDGAVTAIRIREGRAEGAVKVIETEGLMAERARGKPLYGFRAPYFTRLWSALSGRYKNTANTAPMLWQGRLFAMVEAAKPTELDPDTLSFAGVSDLGGAVPAAFSAHPHRVVSRRALYNFGVRYGRETFLDLFELPDAGRARRLGSVKLARPVMLHDFAATDTRLVFLVSPFEVVVPRALLQLGSFGDLFEFRASHGTEVIVVPIDAPHEARRFKVDAFWQWHFANAFDAGNDLIVDFVRFPDASSFHRIGADGALGGDLVRMRVPASASITQDDGVVEGGYEFPTIDPRYSGTEHGVVFSSAESDVTRGIARHDLRKGVTETFADGPHTSYGEPVFVPRAPDSPEGVGHLLTMVIDARMAQSHLAIFDAERVEAGPVAKLWFDDALPISFHGVFRRKDDEVGTRDAESAEP